MLYEYASKVRSRSIALGIKSIRPEEGFILYTATAVIAAGRRSIHVVDAGAGIGHSTIWIGQALEDFCLGPCRLTAVEIDPLRASEARRVLSGLSWSKVVWSIERMDALSFIESLEDESISLAFVDVEKATYPRALRLLSRKLEWGGVALFHNAYYPPPPPEFYRMATEPPWLGSIIPTPEGMYILIKQGQGNEVMRA
jgi:predicted O-methyltransferase YrrM